MACCSEPNATTSFVGEINLMNEPRVIVLIFLAVFVLIGMLIFGLFMFGIFRPWMRGLMSGCGLPVPDIIGMRLRRINVNAVLDALILARQSDVTISSTEMQRAYLKGVDLEKVTLATIEARRRDLPFTFEEFVDAELRGRLEEKLRGSPGVSPGSGPH